MANKKNWCSGSGAHLRDENFVGEYHSTCPKCGRLLKYKLALGGYETERPRYAYLPHHLSKRGV